MWADLRADFRRFSDGSPKESARALLRQGFWACADYRFGHWARSAPPRWIRPVFVVPSVIWHLVVESLTGISISPSAKIGPGLFIGHFGSIFVNSDAVLGRGCSLSQEVTIGADVAPPFGAPSIGNGVYLAPGAKVFGAITIGDHVAIGANAVVRDDLPDRAIAVGIPARVVRVQDADEVSVPDIAR